MGVGGQREVGIEPKSGTSSMARTATLRCPAVLAWMDLEMTGLDPDEHVIVEIATLDHRRRPRVVAEGPDLVIHHPADALADDGRHSSATMHTRAACCPPSRRRPSRSRRRARPRSRSSRSTSPSRARCRCAATRSAPTAASSLAYLPEIEDYLHYRSRRRVDDQGAGRRWYPRRLTERARQGRGHRALDDIRESVDELRYYRGAIFKPSTT